MVPLCWACEKLNTHGSTALQPWEAALGGLSLMERARCLPEEQPGAGTRFPGCDPVSGMGEGRP